MKRNWRVPVILIILLLVINLVALLIPFDKTTAFWISDIFTILAIIAQYPVSRIAGKSSHADLKSRFYGWPIMRVGLVYLVAVLISAVVFTLISVIFNGFPLWFPLIIYIVETGAAGVGLITVENARNYAETQDQKLTDTTRTMRDLKLTVDQIIANCHDTALLEKLRKLSDELRYSDPVSGSATEEIESDLRNKLTEIALLVSTDPIATASKVDETSALLKLRNQMCKEGKRR